ncbi:DNA (cytosine-5-)-methyltransferase 3 beta, duplicate a [Puntigrus tetrazona]|uniref:DNA (cytosine-5-)-methyltransferase 3 beta, duplicate a n=1 Tax=Puntigrus tetrazona TaxID=1606681 RepID=UPI001C89B354|nr:DNA (cytosine-5-)-methyltransferase 3 beta, duplicate a [Puntigrus tetrazona]
MAMNVSLDPSNPDDKCSRYDVLSWINETLETNFTQVEQCRSGACFCQLMDLLFPGSIDMSKVKFESQKRSDFKHNYNLLETAFRKSGIKQTVPVKQLLTGKFRPNFTFLKWFRKFFFANERQGREYNPVEARNGQDIVQIDEPVKSPRSWKNARESGRVRDKSDKDMELNGTRRPLTYDSKWERSFKWIRASHRGDNCAYCTLCDHNIILHAGFFDLKQHQQTQKHMKNEMGELNSSGTKYIKNSLSCSETMLLFIQNHCLSSLPSNISKVSQRTANYILGLNYPIDIVSACKMNPYCIYIYGQVPLYAESRESTSCHVVLVGFFEEKQARYCIRLLDVFQAEDGSSVSGCLVNVLQKFELPAGNMVAFYINDSEQTSGSVVSQIQELNPKVIDLGGLYSMPDSACSSGLQTQSNQVHELIANIYEHFSTCSTSNDKLKMLFADIEGLKDIRASLSHSCEEFCVLVQRMLEMWSDLLSYFASCNENRDKTKQICLQLENPKIRITLMFLDHALGPLRAFEQHLQQSKCSVRANLVQILREASGLLRSYASSFLCPQAVIRYLKERDPAILENSTFCLPATELSLGGAVEDFISAREEELADSINVFHTECLAFYKTLTTSIADSLPLSDSVLRGISQLLSPAGRLKVTGKSIVDLAVQFDICSKPEDSAKLTDEFLEYQLVEDEDDSSSTLSLEQYWCNVLKTFPAESIFKRLVLCFLVMPCPSLEAENIFAQAVENGDVAHWEDSSGESDTDLTKDLDSNDDSSLDHAEVMISPIRNGQMKNSREMVQHSDTVKPCVVRLEKITSQREMNLKDGADDDIWTSSAMHEASVRGIYGWESSLRQKPQERTVFQAGTGTWSKPVNPDKDCKPEVVKNNSRSSASNSPSPKSGKREQAYHDGKGYAIGELVWGKVKGFSWWPGLVVVWKGRVLPVSMRRVEWFGDGMFSEIHTEGLLPFAAFAKCFCTKSYEGLPTYKNAIYQILELAAERCGKNFLPSKKKGEEVKAMLDWAFGGFKPTGPDGFLPPVDSSTSKTESDSSVSDYQPPAKRKYVIKNRQSVQDYTRDQMVHEVTVKGRNIEDFCLSCGSANTEIFHPLFKGSLCFKCKENFTETLYRYDEDGYQSYCTVCCAGLEVILCGNASCCRCFCKDCLNTLVGPETFDKLKEVDPWSCYICLPSKCYGVLKLRPDWSVRVQEYFANNSAFEFVSFILILLKLTSAERNYDVGNKELLSMKAAIEEWQHWLEGATNPFQVITNHRKLEYIKGKARWALFFTRFHFTVMYRPGSKNGKVDALSRCHDRQSESRSGTHSPPIHHPCSMNWDIMEDIQREQQQEPPPLNVLQIRSISRTVIRIIQNAFWWLNMIQSISSFVKSCSIYAQSKTSKELPFGLLQPFPIPQQPRSHLSIDFFTGLHNSNNFTTILVIIDRFLKSCRLMPLKGLPTAMEIALALFHNVFRVYGLPEDIVSGTQFTSQVWKAFCKQLDINISLTSGYHPQSNGQVERLNQEIGRVSTMGRIRSEFAHPFLYRTHPIPESFQRCLQWMTGYTIVRGFGSAFMFVSSGRYGSRKSTPTNIGTHILPTNQDKGSGSPPEK